MDFWPSRLSNIFFEITISCSIFVVELTAAAVVTVISSSLLESSMLFNVQIREKIKSIIYAFRNVDCHLVLPKREGLIVFPQILILEL